MRLNCILLKKVTILESSRNNDSTSVFKIQNNYEESDIFESETSHFSDNNQSKWILILDQFGFIVYWSKNSREVLGRDPEYIERCHFPDLIEETSRSFINQELMRSDLKTNFHTSRTFRFPLHKDFKWSNRSIVILFKIQRMDQKAWRSKIKLELNSLCYKVSIRLSSKKSTDEMLRNYKEAHDDIFRNSMV